MAWIRIRKGIINDGPIELIDKQITTGGSSGSSSITLPANDTYILSCVLSQSSGDWYTGYSSLNPGSWSYSTSPMSDIQLFTDSATRGSGGSLYNGGTDRIYTEHSLVTVGNTPITATRNGTTTGSSNIIVEVAAVRSGKKTVEFSSKKIGSNGFDGDGTGSASTSSNAVLQANSTYIVSCVISQTSKQDYAVNSGWSIGSWGYSVAPISTTQLFTDSTSRIAGRAGTLRTYTEQILVEVGDSPITVSRNGSCSGYGGNIIVEVASVKIT